MHNEQPVRIGVVGYGAGGQWFHTPFIVAAEGVELAGVVARSADKQAAVRVDHPGVPVFGSLTEMLAAGIDAVTITTPPSTRRELVLEAVAAGVAVVADKPFAADPVTAREQRAAAAGAGVPLAAFHNRRWDADLVTLRDVVAADGVGWPLRFSSLFELVEPDSIPTGVGGGLIGDLGSHLIDQAVSLFGPVDRVSAHFDHRDARGLGLGVDGDVDAAFVVTAFHTSGVVSHLEASKVAHRPARRLRLVGTDGTYEASSTDVQAQRVIARGERPVDDPDGWAFEPEPATLVRADGTTAVPSSRGSYTEYYEQFGRAVRVDGPVPVSADDAVHVIDVVEAAVLADREQRTVRVAEIADAADATWASRA